MEFEKDEFVVSFNQLAIAESEILAACEESGFPATVVVESAQEQSEQGQNEAQDSAGLPGEFSPPEFFVQALKLAKKENKPLVLDFMATWCAPCKRLSDETFVDKDVAALLQKCVLLKIDTDEFPDIAKKYKVSSLPDIRFLSPQGNQLKKMTGFQEAKPFAQELGKLIKGE